MKIKEKPVQKTFKMTPIKKTKSSMSKKTKSKVSKPKKKVDISKMSVDNFMSGGFNDIDNDSDLDDSLQDISESSSKLNGKAKLKKKKGEDCDGFGGKILKSKKGCDLIVHNIQGIRDSLDHAKDNEAEGVKGKSKEKKFKINGSESQERGNLNGDEGNEDSNADEDEENIFEEHKKQLNNLKTSDPEFYKYLKENDEDLLNFNDSESDEGEEVEACHTAPESLEIASDESDFEPEEGGLSLKRNDRSITIAMITSWQERLATTKNKKLLRDVFDAFHAAVIRVSSEDDQSFRFKVEGSSVFNAIIRMCVMELNSGIKSFLKLEEGSRAPPTQSKLWPRIKPLLKTYFEDLTELAGVTSPDMLTVLLKHIHQMIPYLVYFPNVAQRTLRRLIDLWSKSEDVVRVLTFLCLLRLTSRNHSFLSSTLKKMYITYVKNTKFVSPTTLPEINFMRQSLSELFALDDTISYQMAFVYIRQLAVHLRNAVTLKKKENFQAVYNWQFISSLQLWAELFCIVPNGSPLRSLVYPLIQIIIGTIKLIPSSQYYPLRFHCCKILVNISSKCGIFIPVMPFILEVLQDFDFNREHKKLSMKPMDLTCLLRCSKLQMKENGFKDALMEYINNLLVEYIAVESHRISFPDIFVPSVLQMKQFVKNCKVVNYTKLIKALLDKINENSKFIENERKSMNFKLNDVKAVEAIEVGIKTKGTPFLNYYENWKKVYMQKQARKVVDNVKLGDYKLPVIYKLDKKRSREQSRSVGPPVLFPSDDEDSNVSFGLGNESEPDDDREEKQKKKRKIEDEKKGKSPAVNKNKLRKMKKKAGFDKEMDGEDDVHDLVLSDDD